MSKFYNPYDLVELVINGKPIVGRPIEFDSAVVNNNTMKNAFGTIVKPVKVSTVCPDCGHGMVVNVAFGDPPFDPVPTHCERCQPDWNKQLVVDPFINPVATGRVDSNELDPLLYPSSVKLQDDNLTVAERMARNAVPAAEPVVTVNEMLIADEPPSEERQVPIEPVADAELGEEVDLGEEEPETDDTEMDEGVADEGVADEDDAESSDLDDLAETE